MFKRTALKWGATLFALALIGSSAMPALAQQTIPPTPTPIALDTFDPSAAGGRTVVKWYVGLGTGANPQQVEIEKNAVDQFNSSQSSIYRSEERRVGKECR